MTETSKTIQKENSSSAKRIFKKTIDIAFTICLLIVVLLAVYAYQSKKAGGQAQVGGYQLFVVLSGSMSPTFDTGSIVIIKKIDPEDVVVGDVVTFTSASDTGKTITHRVIEIDTKGTLSFTTKGDANNVADSVKLDSEKIIGKVQFSVPYVGYFLEFSKTKTGLYLLIVLPSMIIFLLEVSKIIGYIGERNKAKRTPEQKSQEIIKKAGKIVTTDHLVAANKEDLNEYIKDIRDRQAKAEMIKEEMDSPGNYGRPILENPDKESIDIIAEAQKASTQKIYQYKIQAEKDSKELQDKLDMKLLDEENLDKSIRLIKTTLIEKLNSYKI